ncbi:C-Cbl-associated protein isoform A [Operophtera brumata]|uniref:C-Cbl-associated protein isoform A n=1 Tax=Operophtera brumata TaxID=104452 RepID=A0A0L7L637_OPEBR|nr:C-Cbl-associated protein isoform A [Operophtera brumata]
MPEKTKRRNKNKNKRKNKNNQSDNNKNVCDVIEKDSDPCNVQSDIDKNSECQGNTEVCKLSVFLALINDLPGPSIVDVEDGIVESQDTEAYIVESPEQSLKTKSNKSKLTITIKSKSLDNDDEPNIVEITEDISTQSEEESTLAVIDTNNVLVSDIESDVEWENADELHNVEISPSNEVATGTVSITSVPLNVAQCQQTKPLTPEMEISLRNYLKTLDLSTNPENVESVEIKAEIEQIINREIKHRLRKKALADDFGLQRLGPPRMLDVIDEEGSSESSMTSRRQSYLSDKKSDIDDLEDDVFEDSSKSRAISQKVASTFPKQSFGRLVPQQCVLVGAKIKDPEITEARGDWTMSTVEKMTGAEVVYLTDSSSSTSSLHDFGDEIDDGVETDVTVRMITPTIEVTDTEHLLKKTFIPETNDEYNLPKNYNPVLADKSVDTLHDTEKNDLSQKTNNENNPHEIVVLSTDNLKTNLYVKEIQHSDIVNDYKVEPISNNKNSSDINPQHNNDYDLEMKVLKCELNDAINNLIKEVSDSELNENSSSMFARRDSSSSVCSSQCTAKYNPTYSSLNDVSNIVHDEVYESNKPNVESIEKDTTASHVKEVFEHVAGTAAKNKKIIGNNCQPLFLRDICVKRIAKLPYGDKILEELASVSKHIQNIASHGFVSDNSTNSGNCKEKSSCETKMPYFPVPDLSSIEKVVLPTKTNDSVPPPVKPRRSSLIREKSREEDLWTGVPTKNEPVYVCLSPSQKMLMEKTNTILSKDDASDLMNTHKNYVDRRGYNECYKKEDHKDESGVDVTPIVSFKSQTGSRLLALIRDPTLTNSINSINNNSSSELFENKFKASQNLSIRNNSHLVGNSDTFRPIPPPRPKKMSAFYESDESSDVTDSSLRSMKSERKFFHYSTGNLSKEIEDDVSTIQHMHRNYTNTRDKLDDNRPRRPSLPKDLCDQQMEYIRQKEKEVEAEILRLEAQSNKISTSSETKIPKSPFVSEKDFVTEKFRDSNNFFISKQRDFFASSQNSGKIERPEKGKLHSVFSRSQEELLREKMYSEYVTQMAEREERKQHKVIKITNTHAAPNNKVCKSMPALDILDSKVNNRIEKEFICKARERWDKLGIKDPETEDERDIARSDVYREPKVIQHTIKVIEGNEERDVRNLPRHLQEFVRFTAKDKEKKADSSGESDSRPASPHVMIWCAVIIIVLAVGKYFLRLLRNK